jgi:hypothetical protein
LNYILAYPYSAIVYVFVLFHVVFLAFLAQLSKSKVSGQIFVCALILSLTLLAGLRDISVGIDTRSYYMAILSASPGYSGEQFYNYFEIGFVLLLKGLIFLVKDPHCVILLVSWMIHMLMIETLWSFKNDVSFSFSVFLYYTMYYFETYNVMRQWLAIAIIFFALRYLLEDQYLKFVCFLLIATTMHSSAIICMVFIPIHMLIVHKVPLKYKVLIGVAIIVYLTFSDYFFGLLGVESVFERYKHYYIGGSTSISFGFYFVLRLCILLFALFLLKQDSYALQHSTFIKNMIALTFLGTLLTMTGYVIRYADRLGTYAVVYEIMLWPLLIKSKKTPALVAIFKLAAILLALYVFYVGLQGSIQGQMPYKLFFG